MDQGAPPRLPQALLVKDACPGFCPPHHQWTQLGPPFSSPSAVTQRRPLLGRGPPTTRARTCPMQPLLGAKLGPPGPRLQHLLPSSRPPPGPPVVSLSSCAPVIPWLPRGRVLVGRGWGQPVAVSSSRGASAPDVGFSLLCRLKRGSGAARSGAVGAASCSHTAVEGPCCPGTLTLTLGETLGEEALL